MAPGRSKLTASVYLDPAGIDALKAIAAAGRTVYFQTIPAAARYRWTTSSAQIKEETQTMLIEAILIVWSPGSPAPAVAHPQLVALHGGPAHGGLIVGAILGDVAYASKPAP
jgi:hypothetical protein